MTVNESIYKSLKKASDSLKEVMKEEYSEVVRDATIQRFEYTFELCWKLMQRIVEDQKHRSIGGVKTVIREAAVLELIEDPSVWMDYLNARNLTVHTYVEVVANDIYKKMTGFVKEVDHLIERSGEYDICNGI